MSWREIFGIITEEEAAEKAQRLPEWVKCVYCGGRPKANDYLGEIVRHSTALAHQSCMAKRGKIFGLNAGTLQEIGGSVKPPEESST